MATFRLLTFTTLYPNNVQPNHGVFVENRLRHLVDDPEAASTVVAPVPYFPDLSGWLGTAGRLATWSQYAKVAATEMRHGLTVHHPRYTVIPRFGMSLAPWLLYRAAVPALRRLLADGLTFDAIDAHYLYPDGVAAVWLGRLFRRPVVVTARGTDVNLIPRYPVPRLLIRHAMAEAAGLIAVSAALKQAMVDLGAPPDKVTVLRNGVDLAMFRPVDRAAARARLGLTRPTLISVGHLIERKGHHRVIEALLSLPECELLIVGEGPERSRLAALVEQLGLGDRVRLLGARPHDELPELYGAADILVLASSREGWANVLLEAMACGTPTVASNIWGNPEVVQAPEAGLIAENTPEALGAAARRLLTEPPSRAATRAYAERFDWGATTAGQLALFRRVIATWQAAGHRTPAATPAVAGQAPEA
jgi:teichuronic acid biosynthesis glycosyltransferase TuaC